MQTREKGELKLDDGMRRDAFCYAEWSMVTALDRKDYIMHNKV